MDTIDVPVLIVGAGPSGVATALLLRRLGVDSCLVERRGGPQRAPAAHVVNARTFEICRQAGVDMDAIAAAAQSPADAGATWWVTQLGGEVLGRLPFERQDDDVLALTPTPLRNLSQHRFEPLLPDALRGAGADAPRYGHRWEAAAADGEGAGAGADGGLVPRCFDEAAASVAGGGAGAEINARDIFIDRRIFPGEINCAAVGRNGSDARAVDLGVPDTVGLAGDGAERNGGDVFGVGQAGELVE
jgi:hypothetical protein